MESTVVKSVESFFGNFTQIQYKTGDIIVRADDVPSGVFYLRKGYVRQYIIADSGIMLVHHMFKPRAFFPLSWVVNDEPNRYYLEAVTPVETWRAPKTDVQQFLRSNPAVVYDVTARLLAGLCGMRRRFEYLMTDTAYHKTVLLLLYFIDTLGEKSDGGIVLPIPITHREIAAWIGTTRETASLQIETLKRRDLIRYQKRHMFISNIALLEKELGMSYRNRYTTVAKS